MWASWSIFKFEATMLNEKPVSSVLVGSNYPWPPHMTGGFNYENVYYLFLANTT